MTRISPRTLFAIAIIFVLTTLAFRYPLPFAADSPQRFLTDLLLFIGYVYLARTLVRLPIALMLMVRFTLHSRRRRGMGRWESVLDGYYRGFLDHRRWTVGQLALLDRLALLGIVWLSVTPAIGTLLVKIGGLVGLALMLIVYLIGGTFSFLLDDSRDGEGRVSLPFLNIRHGE